MSNISEGQLIQNNWPYVKQKLKEFYNRECAEEGGVRFNGDEIGTPVQITPNDMETLKILNKAAEKIFNVLHRSQKNKDEFMYRGREDKNAFIGGIQEFYSTISKNQQAHNDCSSEIRQCKPQEIIEKKERQKMNDNIEDIEKKQLIQDNWPYVVRELKQLYNKECIRGGAKFSNDEIGPYTTMNPNEEKILKGAAKRIFNDLYHDIKDQNTFIAKIKMVYNKISKNIFSISSKNQQAYKDDYSRKLEQNDYSKKFTQKKLQEFARQQAQQKADWAAARKVEVVNATKEFINELTSKEAISISGKVEYVAKYVEYDPYYDAGILGENSKNGKELPIPLAGFRDVDGATRIVEAYAGQFLNEALQIPEAKILLSRLLCIGKKGMYRFQISNEDVANMQNAFHVFSSLGVPSNSIDVRAYIVVSSERLYNSLDHRYSELGLYVAYNINVGYENYVEALGMNKSQIRNMDEMIKNKVNAENAEQNRESVQNML